MNRPPSPCVLCSRFHRQDDAPAGYGMCSGYDKLRRHDDTNEACPLFLAKKAGAGQASRSAETRMDAASNRGAGQRPRRTNETISRASAQPSR
jgi:hypothetical protein